MLSKQRSLTSLSDPALLVERKDEVDGGQPYSVKRLSFDTNVVLALQLTASGENICTVGI